MYFAIHLSWKAILGVRNFALYRIAAKSGHMIVFLINDHMPMNVFQILDKY